MLDTKTNKKTYIVIGSEHYNPLGVIRSLGEERIKCIAIIRKGAYGFASKSKYIDKLYMIDSYSEALDILDLYISESNPPVVIPCDDVIVKILDEKFDSLKGLILTNNAGKSGRIGFFSKKKNQLDLARKHGLNVAKTWTLQNQEIPNDIEYPIITKPTYSYDDWKQDYYICNSDNELNEALRKVKGPIFLQSYIHKKTELCIDGVVVAKGTDVLPAISSTYTYALPDYYSSEMVISNCNESIRKSLKEMFSEIGFEGIFEAEFMIDSANKLWFLEINFRNSTWSYASTCLKMNLPLLFGIGMTNGHLPENCEKIIPKGYLANAELMDFLHRVIKYKMISPLEWFKRVRKADCLFFYNKKDPKPFWSIVRYQIKKIVFGVFSRSK